MNDISIATALGAVSLVLAVTFCIHEVEYAAGLKQQVNRNEACVKGVAAGDGAAVLAGCGLPVADLFTNARDFKLCDIALGKGEATPSCSANVQSLVASNAGLEAELQQTVKDRDAAILRASARATELAKRKATDEKVLNLAPHDLRGDIVCDAGCLRARFDAAPGS